MKYLLALILLTGCNTNKSVSVIDPPTSCECKDLGEMTRNQFNRTKRFYPNNSIEFGITCEQQKRSLEICKEKSRH